MLHVSQVNAGPLTYAKVFLEDNKVSVHPANTVDQLRRIFRLVETSAIQSTNSRFIYVISK